MDPDTCTDKDKDTDRGRDTETQTEAENTDKDNEAGTVGGVPLQPTTDRRLTPARCRTGRRRRRPPSQG